MARGGRRLRVILVASLALNLVFGCAGGFWALRKMMGGSSQSPYYEAYTSVFEDAVPERDVDVCFLGDSITQRALWSEFLPELKVANRGIGSDTTEGVLGRLETAVDGIPETVVLMIGINDLAQGVPEDEIVGNVREIVNSLHEALPSSLVVLMSVLPAASVDDGMVKSLNTRYSEIISDLPWATFLDIHDLYLNADGVRDDSLYDADGVHLDGLGYIIWIEELENLLFTDH